MRQTIPKRKSTTDATTRDKRDAKQNDTQDIISV